MGSRPDAEPALNGARDKEPHRIIDVRQFWMPSSRLRHGPDRRVAAQSPSGARSDDSPTVPSPLDADPDRATLQSLLDLPERLGRTIWIVDPDHASNDLAHCANGPARQSLRRLDAWDGAAARTFAVECAERALPILLWHAPDDDRPSRLLAVGRECIGGRLSTVSRACASRDARAYELDIAEHSCHPAILPAARACAATVRACVWGAVRVAAASAAEAEAARAAWDAAWAAARDAAWFACTAEATDRATEAAWRAAWAATFQEARSWQAARLAHHLSITQ